MTPEQLTEANGLYARWSFREKLGLLWYEIQAIETRLKQLGIQL
jgi:hypothetical protein